VIGADARVADPAKRQVRIAQMNKSVVNNRPAADTQNITDDLLFLLLYLPLNRYKASGLGLRSILWITCVQIVEFQNGQYRARIFHSAITGSSQPTRSKTVARYSGFRYSDSPPTTTVIPVDQLF